MPDNLVSVARNDRMITELKKLLSDYKTLPTRKRVEPTFLELAGFPHYENVISNLLAFFLDPNEAHAFGSLLLDHLIQKLGFGADLSAPNTDVKVLREVRTHTGNRIDILAILPDAALIIESKIYANLYNDLGDYAQFAASQYPDKKQLKLVLSLRPIQSNQLTDDFGNLTLSQLLNAAQLQLDACQELRANKYRILFEDLVSNIANLTEERPMDQQTLEFFAQNMPAINRLIEEHRAIQNNILRRINAIKSRIEFDPKDVTQWIWQQHDLVHDFYFPNDVTVALDTYFELDGISIVIWVRKQGNPAEADFLKKLQFFKVQDMNNFQRTNENRIILKSKNDLSYFADDRLIIETLNAIIKQLVVLP